MVRNIPFALALVIFWFAWLESDAVFAIGIKIDHQDTDLTALNPVMVEQAKRELHIAYAHTSHGSQVTEGMTAMNLFINGGGLGMSCPTDTFRWNDGPAAGELDLDDYFAEGDLGNPDYRAWAARTREYLDSPSNSDVNVVMWSWCGQADTTEANINLYLNLMSQLEFDYPSVNFVYMTGHVNGCSTTGNLFLRNQQIRNYCEANNKILYDFADIESWDPDGNYYGDKLVTDNCDYDSDGNGSRDRNWAIDWQNAHVEGVDWFDCSCAHSQPLNGNRKAYAAWALWTSLAAAIDAVAGDASYDGWVDEMDAAILAEKWLTAGADWSMGDFNKDGMVNDVDAALMAVNWHYGVSAFVPEPAVALLLLELVVILSLLRRGG